MSNDPADLPMRATKPLANRPNVPTVLISARDPTTVPTQGNRPALTNEQFTTLVERGATAIAGAFEIAKMLVETQRIQVQSLATVNEIRARSDAFERAMQAETDRLLVERKNIRTRGEAAALLITSVMSLIPEGDQTSRQLALEKLGEWIKCAARASE